MILRKCVMCYLSNQRGKKGPIIFPKEGTNSQKKGSIPKRRDQFPKEGTNSQKKGPVPKRRDQFPKEKGPTPYLNESQACIGPKVKIVYAIYECQVHDLLPINCNVITNRSIC